MKAKILFLLFLFISVFSFSQTDSAVFPEDEILQKIELGDPSIPSLRYKHQYIYPIGKWCTVNSDSIRWKLSQVNSNSLLSQCDGLYFKGNGQLEEHVNDHFVMFDKRRINFIVRDSILEFVVVKKGSTKELEQYIVEDFIEQKMTLKLLNIKKVSSESFTPIFGNSEDTENTVINVNGKKLTYSRSKCTMFCSDAKGIIWQRVLNSDLCNIIYLKPLKKPVKNFQVVFQTDEKKIYILNLNNGKTKKITMKQFEKIVSK
ncbi:MAG: hypothetical protein JNL24_06750 [Bacteroidia bacterium]|nr:hypothetical protein [Bacteroidia bacterium]